MEERADPESGQTVSMTIGEIKKNYPGQWVVVMITELARNIPERGIVVVSDASEEEAAIKGSEVLRQLAVDEKPPLFMFFRVVSPEEAAQGLQRLQQL